MGEGPQRGMSTRRTVVIVGAGAAGLWCAERLARACGSETEVLVLEKTPRTGTKILASGGTRCNVTTTLGPDEAAGLFGQKAERFLRHGFRTLTPQDVRERFEGWGVGLEEAPLEKVFPRSGNARDVRDALEAAARGAGASIELGAPVEGIARDGYRWRVDLEDGMSIGCEALVLAAGGMSYPGTGTTGDGYPWLRSLGLEVVDPVPALVPLTSPDRWVRELTGIAWQGAELVLEDRASGKATRLGQRRRPVLFTHHGLSGPGAMDLSHHVARAVGQAPLDMVVRLDAFPDLDREAVRAALIEATGLAGNPRLQRALAGTPMGPMPKRLFAAFAGASGLDPEVGVAGLAKRERHRLVEALKGLEIPVDGTLGFEHAEVTAGGLALRQVSPRSMAVNGHDGLFVIGELLDVDGPIGGLSFQAAFATAELCAVALAG